MIIVSNSSTISSTDYKIIDVSWYDKFLTARNPNTPQETLERLSYDKDSCVRIMVAKNPNTPPEALDRMSYDEDSDVRWFVAHNPNTPQYIKDLYKFKNYLKHYERN